MNKVGRYGAAAAVLVAASLVGCDAEDPEPKISPSPTASSSSPSASPSATPEAETPAAFIRRWVELQREAQNTGETAELKSLSEKCDPCMAFLRRIDDIYAEGGFIQTDGWLIRKVAKPRQSPQGVQVDVSVTSTPTTFRESSNGETQTLQGGELVERFALESASESWIVTDLVEVSK